MQFISPEQALENLVNAHPELLNQGVRVVTRGLPAQEAIGKPARQDYPLLTGKEVLVQAEIGPDKGQAFTADPLPFAGTLRELLALPHERPGNRAVIIAALNAVASRLGITDHTIHCRDEEPEVCSRQISEYLLARHGRCKVGIIGYQPAILENCVRCFGPDHVRITDLNPDNTGKTRYGVTVWDGFTATEQLIAFADVILITGSVLANDTFNGLYPLLAGQTFYFYGTTAAALASLNGFPRLCYKSR